ncbi:MAG: saccharopine dehydrogenase NADP-binding domain-containing protein, partial [Anaerolineales bacterium]
MRIFVLGAGASGGLLAQLLARQGHEVRCGDRDPERARRFLGPKLPCEGVNARNQWAIVRAAQGSHLIVNGVAATFNEIVLRAALRLRAHYFDMAAN